PSNCLMLPCMADLLLLAFLAGNVLALIANALALVGLWRPRGANLGGELADLLLVDAGHRDDFLLGSRHLDLDARRDLVHHIVAESDLQLQIVLALHGRAETDAVDLERLRIALRAALDQVEDLRAGHAPHGARLLGILAHGNSDSIRALFDGDQLGTGK